MLAGGFLLLVSFYLSNTIVALAGIAFAFWGILFLYLGNGSYLKEEVVTSAVRGQGAVLEQLLDKMGRFSQGVHLPPKSIGEVSSEKVLLGAEVPLQELDGSTLKGTAGVEGMVISAPGLQLVRYYQESGDSDLVGSEMDFVRLKLSKALVEDLEVAETFDLQREGDAVTVTTTGSRLYDLCASMVGSTEAEVRLPCAIHSSFAIVLARALGAPIILASLDREPDGKTIVAKYKMIGGKAAVPP
jgi:hypothetical protein